MPYSPPTRARAVTYLQAAGLPLVFGSTVVLAKAALTEVGPLTLVALRFALAALILLPLALHRPGNGRRVRALWRKLAAMGIGFYAIGNGSLFLGLKLLPATTAALLLSLTPVVVLVMGVPWLRELPTLPQLAGIVVCIAGSVLFFARGIHDGEPAGIAIVTVGLLGSAGYTLMARDLARRQAVDTTSLTALPLTFGAAILLPLALLIEGVPHLTARGGAFVLVLALLNTVGAFLLYNRLLASLTAFELTTLLNLNPLVTAVLAWIVLGNGLSALQIAALIIVLAAVLTVQVTGRKQEVEQ